MADILGSLRALLGECACKAGCGVPFGRLFTVCGVDGNPPIRVRGVEFMAL